LKIARFRPALLAVALVTTASIAFAAPSEAEIAVARELFDEAQMLQKEQRWVEAADKLRQAISVKDTPGLRYHLAHVEVQMGLLVEALVNYQRAEELLRSGAKGKDVERLLEPAQQAVRERVPTLSLVLPSDAEGVELEIDKKAVAPLLIGGPIPLNPGSHWIVVTAAERQQFKLQVMLDEKEERVIRVDLPPLQPKRPQPVEDSRPSGRQDPRADTHELRTYVLIGETAFTLTALGVGIAYSIARSSAATRVEARQKDIDDESGRRLDACYRTVSLPQACTDLATAIDDYQQARTLALVGFVAAGLGAVATATTWLLWPKETRTASSVRMRLQAGSDGAYAEIGGSF
jgi:tetratricopeptide (TPR) repeat protein